MRLLKYTPVLVGDMFRHLAHPSLQYHVTIPRMLLANSDPLGSANLLRLLGIIYDRLTKASIAGPLANTRDSTSYTRQFGIR